MVERQPTMQTTSDGFIEALTHVAHDNTDIAERDHATLLDAIAKGQLPYDPGEG